MPADQAAPFSSFAHPDNYYLLEAMEILTKDASDGEHFLAWGFLIRDKAIATEPNVARAVVAMTLDQRRELRDRVKSLYESPTA